jgi:hypothetical protein
MTTATLVRFPLLSQLLARYRSWRWSRAKTVCQNCSLSRKQADAECVRLLKAGHHRAAVFMARIMLEREIEAMASGTSIEGRGSRIWLRLLVENRRLTSKQANRMNTLYSRASKMCHGGACPSRSAKFLIADIRRIIDIVRNDTTAAAGPLPPPTANVPASTRKVIAGFAGPAGVANWVTRVATEGGVA